MMVFNTICQVAVDNQLVSSHPALYELSIEDWDTVFNHCYTQLIAELESVSNKVMLNPGTKSYTTVCDWIRESFYDDK
jgi:hypothetical protein